MKHSINKDKVYIYSAFTVILIIILFALIQSCKKLEIERIVKIETGGISDITTNSAVVSGTINDAGEKGISQHGHCWAASANPTVDFDARTELGSSNNIGSFNSNITEIAPGTKYYIRAYATSYRITSYGDNVSFTTNETFLPTVTTKLPENITANSATCGGNVTDDGGEPVTERGVCWSTSENPTLSDNHTTNGGGMGEFTSSLTGLSGNTTYYVRAYATSSAGTAYGDELSFTTQDEITLNWQKTYGGSSWDWPFSIQQTTDEGYVFAGGSNSNDGDVQGNMGGYDYWIVKLTSSGEINWQKSLGGSSLEYATHIKQTTDGGYIIAGRSNSNDGDVSGNHGSSDYWIVKLTSSGEINWQKSLGGSGYEEARSIQPTTDGGYIIAGSSSSNDGDVSGNHGGDDFWIVKINSSGEIEWQKSLGGSSQDWAYSVAQSTDGGYIIAGTSESTDEDVSGNHGAEDCWIVKLTPAGEIEWQKSLGGSGDDRAWLITNTADEGYIIAGWSDSNDGDVSGNHGDYDYWIVKLSSAGETEWQKSLGGSALDKAWSVQQTIDEGYIIVGQSSSNDGDVSGNHGDTTDYWIVKLSSSGEIEWQRSFGGYDFDAAYSIQHTSDGGYIIGGETLSGDGDVPENKGGYDAWIIKLVEN